jgi:uncharacterized membrane protein YagU involved in acid resistance
MNIIGAIVAGLVGALIFSLVMMMAPQMGMPKMAIWETLGAMFSPDGNVSLGWVMHLMMGLIFGIIYAALWTAGLGSVTVVGGLIFGIVHWLVVGLMMGGMPMMHAGIKAGTVSTPGVYMLNNGGMKSFMGGLIGHIIFGVVVALVYGLFV